jgi:hypothetical protein
METVDKLTKNPHNTWRIFQNKLGLISSAIGVEYSIFE